METQHTYNKHIAQAIDIKPQAVHYGCTVEDKKPKIAMQATFTHKDQQTGLMLSMSIPEAHLLHQLLGEALRYLKAIKDNSN